MEPAIDIEQLQKRIARELDARVAERTKELASANEELRRITDAIPQGAGWEHASRGEPFETEVRARRGDGEYRSALLTCRGRVSGPSGAAAMLGLPRQTLDSKIRALHIDKHRFEP